MLANGGPKGNIIPTPVEAQLSSRELDDTTKPKDGSALAVVIVKVWGCDQAGLPDRK